ncbi:MAG: cupredoxin family copper-binding protein [archaeon]
MKSGVVFGIILVIALIIAGYFLFMGKSSDNLPLQNSGTESGNIIEIKNFAFQPNELTISQGDTVVWTNKDAGVKHTVTSDSGNELDSELLSKGESYSHTFNEKGTFDYHCTPHPYMEGKVIVE